MHLLRRCVLVVLGLLAGTVSAQEPQLQATFVCGSGAEAVAFSPDGKKVAVACRESLQIWEVAKETRIVSLKLPYPAGDRAVAFHPSGKHLVFSVEDELQVFNLEKNEVERTIAKKAPLRTTGPFDGKGSNAFKAPHFTQDGKKLIGIRRDGDIVSIDFESGKETVVKTMPARSYNRLALRPDAAAVSVFAHDERAPQDPDSEHGHWGDKMRGPARRIAFHGGSRRWRVQPR
jgi:DNA-binding beta-propeller fold protein YncE